jgi:hypothetical protein
MISTAAGLTVAIPVLICYHWISAKIERLVADIDQMSVDFVDDFGDGSPRRRPVPAPTVERVEKKQTETVVTAGAKVATS